MKDPKEFTTAVPTPPPSRENDPTGPLRSAESFLAEGHARMAVANLRQRKAERQLEAALREIENLKSALALAKEDQQRLEVVLDQLVEREPLGQGLYRYDFGGSVIGESFRLSLDGIGSKSVQSNRNPSGPSGGHSDPDGDLTECLTSNQSPP